MHVKVRRTRVYELLSQVTLKKLRRLSWANCDGLTSLIPCLTAPELSDLAVNVTRGSQPQAVNLATILPPHGSHFPLLIEPNGLEYVYRYGTHLCRVRYDRAAFFFVRELSKNRTIDNAAGHWLTTSAPISFTQMEMLTVEAIGGCLPIEYKQIVLAAFGPNYPSDHSAPSEHKEVLPAGRFRPIRKTQAKRGAAPPLSRT